MFMGTLILCGNLLSGRLAGLAASGFFIFISYFVVYIGFFTFGPGIYYVSPLSWCNISNLDWRRTGLRPDFSYSLIFLILSCLIMGILSSVFFCRRDISIQERRN